MKPISDPSMISKWENLQNSSVFKYLFSSQYILELSIKKKPCTQEIQKQLR